jgi:integrase
MLRGVLKQVGIEGVQPSHVHRHTMASRLVADGTDIRAVADRMGHATVAFTMGKYVHPVEGRDREVAEKTGRYFSSITNPAK